MKVFNSRAERRQTYRRAIPVQSERQAKSRAETECRSKAEKQRRTVSTQLGSGNKRLD